MLGGVIDDIARAVYIAHRLEVRAIRDRATAIDEELTAALADPGASTPMNPLRLAEWIEGRRRQLDHVDVELFVMAFEPAPPVWLVVWEPRVLPWWRGLWWWW